MRVVSLIPSATEILFAVGAGDDVVGVTFECDHPPQARSRPIVSTWRMMVSVHCWKTAGSSVIDLPYLRRRRSAESWIGVSGFLISWAMRRAMSAQAEVRWAETNSVMSSSVTT